LQEQKTNLETEHEVFIALRLAHAALVEALCSEKRLPSLSGLIPAIIARSGP
jgi:hypothetical protein